MNQSIYTTSWLCPKVGFYVWNTSLFLRQFFQWITTCFVLLISSACSSWLNPHAQRGLANSLLASILTNTELAFPSIGEQCWGNEVRMFTQFDTAEVEGHAVRLADAGLQEACRNVRRCCLQAMNSIVCQLLPWKLCTLWFCGEFPLNKVGSLRWCFHRVSDQQDGLIALILILPGLFRMWSGNSHTCDLIGETLILPSGHN